MVLNGTVCVFNLLNCLALTCFCVFIIYKLNLKNKLYRTYLLKSQLNLSMNIYYNVK
jgi:hypothetical protein